ncbi:hypothetical protein O3G_MSEX012221 [Manduca sexta]|uniref:Gustatory receptor 38 n=1 Tax=Manduca sexta TaxID=7130 RepID=A0A5K8B1E9_MANSE|nr:hypothetical protein O3G_MSEX012221 [Manduca sexta]CUQ99378.1 TPA: Gustatory receptor 38 [Manduca sexta]
MADQLVCNINFFLYIRFLFGFYHEFQTSKLVRWLARCYCCLICANIIFFLSYFHTYKLYPKIFIYLLSMEYFMHMLMSLLKSNKYLLQYYKKSPLIDTSVSAYRQMRVCFVRYISVLFFIRLCGFLKIFICHGELNLHQYIFSFMDFIMWVTIVIGRSPLILVFALLYSRVRLMRQILESNDFDCRNQGKHHPLRYVQMFEAIMDRFEASDKYYIHMFISRLTIDERDREVIQKLFLFLKRNPFEYSLWRVVPLNVRSLLSFFSFTVTTIIAILQIQSWNA